jgi:glycosyltransferase involved in cell wall biosynthesis
MKILFATYPMAFHTPGGGEIQLLEYKKALENRGHDVSLFNQWAPNFDNFDVVHFFSCIGGSYNFCKFIKDIKLPLVVSSSLWITEQNKSNYDIEQIKIQLDIADAVVTNSLAESLTLSNIFSINKNKFHVVYNGVSSNFYNQVSPDIFRSKFSIEGKFILNVANIEERKNQINLAHAVNKLSGYKLVLVGHIRDQNYAKRVFDTGGDNLIYIKYIEDSNLLVSAYKACDIFCLPSTLETPGLAAIEAYVNEAKLVITDKGSTKEYFGDNAIYVSPESIDSIFDGLNSAIIQKRIMRSEETVKILKWDDVICSLEELYIKLI